MLAKRLSLFLIAMATVPLVVGAATFALFSAQGSNVDNTFTAGTVGFDNEWHNLTNVTNIAPGDSGTYTYEIQYTGSLDAWVGLDTIDSGDLFTCDGGGHFTVDIVDQNGANYSSNGLDQTAGLYSTNQTLDLSITWALDLAAGNDCQGASATIDMLVKAVQAANNSTPSGPISWN